MVTEALGDVVFGHRHRRIYGELHNSNHGGSQIARVLLLIPSASYRAPDFMEAAHSLGIEIVVGSEQRQALADTIPGRTLELALGSPDVATQTIVEFAAVHPLTAIVSVDDAGTETAAMAAQRLGLPHNAPEAVAATRNKALLREPYCV